MTAPATQEQAAATLQHFYNQQVAEAMPKAIRASLADAQGIGHWLHIATLRSKPMLFGPLGGNGSDERPLLLTLCPATLLVLLFDRRQPAEVTIAARDELQRHYLGNEDVQAATVAQANLMARRAVAHLAQQQAMERAEMQSLYGGEHGVPGVAPALSRDAVEGMDSCMGALR